MCNIFYENDFKINKNVFDHCNLSSSHFREQTLAYRTGVNNACSAEYRNTFQWKVFSCGNILGNNIKILLMPVLDLK